MSSVTNLREAEIERRPIRKLPPMHWLGCFAHFTDEQIRERAALEWGWPEIELRRQDHIVLIRPVGHE